MSRKWTPNANGTGRVNSKNGTVVIPMKKCGLDGFNFEDKESLEYIGVKDYYCPQIKNYSIYGQFYSDIFRYISIKVTKCKNTTTFNECKSTEEID